ncbi:hypothetical protein EAO79_06290 [Plantibacter sp. PA-3-X8]|nr:hypothetical protein EAO79_06290 [Plantibacter sp. PA-3-X8]
MVIVEVPPGARRHGAERCSEPAGFLREFVAVQTGAVEVVVPADAGEHADDHRLAGKFQTMLTRMTAEAQILFGVASRQARFGAPRVRRPGRRRGTCRARRTR